MDAAYGAHAAAIFRLGLTAVPILQGTKRPHPSLSNWSGYCDNLPNAEVQRKWIDQYGCDCGLGVCTGKEVLPGLRFAAIDGDSDAWRGVLRSFFLKNLSGKRGRKGETLFVVAEKSLKSTTLKDHAGKQIVDVLIGGRQTVLPPTMHPETGRPYEWLGQPLTEVSFEELPILTATSLNTLRVLVASEEAAMLLADGDAHGFA